MTEKRKTSVDGTGHGPSGFADAPAVRRLCAVGATFFPARVVLFVAFFAWYLYAVVDMRLVFMARDVLFLWNVSYFTDFLGRAGAPMEWTDNLLVQLCHDRWPSVVVLAAAAWLLLVSTIGLMNVLGRARIAGTWVIPGILLTAISSSYMLPMSMIVGLALALAAANGWCRCISSGADIPVCLLQHHPDGRQECLPHWGKSRLAAFVALSAALYYVVGEAYYCFAACCAIHEALAERRRLSGALFLLAAIGVKFGLDALLAYLGPASQHFQMLAFDPRLDSQPKWPRMLFYGYFPACALFVIFRQTVLGPIKRLSWRRRESGEKKAAAKSGKAGKQPKNVRPEPSVAGAGTFRWLRWTAGTVLALALPAATGFCFLDQESKTLLEIDDCAERRQWNDVLAKAKSLPESAYTQYVNHAVNLALYHKGRLPYEMFSYPQLYPPLLDMHKVPHDTSILKPLDLLLELGRVGEAERMALELHEMWPCGRAIQRLALIKMIQGQPAAASMFLRVLRDDLVWGRWAEEYLQRLAADTNLAGDEQIRKIRRLMLSKDDFDLTHEFLAGGGVFVNSSGLLVDLLKHNRENRMAFEYLMAICLQQQNVQAAVEYSSFLDGFSYPELPPYYEEAALIDFPKRPKNVSVVGSKAFLCGRQIGPSTIGKFRRLQAIANAFGGLNEKAESAMARDLGNSYFYYYFYYASRRRG